MATAANSRFGKVAVLMGGTSAEREVSLRSGQAVFDALIRQGVDAHIVDAQEDVLQVLSDGSFDRAFNILHGRMGEDGVIQGALEVLGMPYTGSGVLASAIGMHKLRTKQIWQSVTLPTPPYTYAHSAEELPRLAKEIGFPMAIKPSHEGSSIGISKVRDENELQKAWELASRYDNEVLAEHWVEGDEYTVSILGGEALPAIRLETPNEFYDYQAKYEANTTLYHCPCGLPESDEKVLQALALNAFDAVGASGWGRVDLMRDAQGKAWLIEVNTVPGMTDHSLVPMAAKQAGMSFDELVIKILETSLSS